MIAVDDLKEAVSRMYDEDKNPVWGILLKDIPIIITDTKPNNKQSGANLTAPL